MELPTNTFKRGLESGETQYGLWLGLPDNTVAEICAQAGFDWLLIDGEHAPFDLRTLLAHLQAMSAYEVSPIARPPHGDTALIKQYLDLGVQSLLIPMVETAEQAAQLAKDVRYPPDGIRGLGGSLARAARWNSVANYPTTANREICLIVQVESLRALENLPAILDIEGVDGVFIGPADLAASMGHVGDSSYPDVVAAITKALTTIRAAGKGAGILCVNPDLIADYEAAGANFVGVGVDTLILSQGAKALATRFKS